MAEGNDPRRAPYLIQHFTVRTEMYLSFSHCLSPLPSGKAHYFRVAHVDPKLRGAGGYSKDHTAMR